MVHLPSKQFSVHLSDLIVWVRNGCILKVWLVSWAVWSDLIIHCKYKHHSLLKTSPVITLNIHLDPSRPPDCAVAAQNLHFNSVKQTCHLAKLVCCVILLFYWAIWWYLIQLTLSTIKLATSVAIFEPEGQESGDGILKIWMKSWSKFQIAGCNFVNKALKNLPPGFRA